MLDDPDEEKNMQKEKTNRMQKQKTSLQNLWSETLPLLNVIHELQYLLLESYSFRSLINMLCYHCYVEELYKTYHSLVFCK